MNGETFLLLGGAGLVGLQIARRIANDLAPRKIIIAALFEEEVQQALADLQAMFHDRPIEWQGIWGDIFVRRQFAHTPRGELLRDEASRHALYEDLFGPLEEAYQRSRLVEIILQTRPNVIIDSINTATAISYQDVYSASLIARRNYDQFAAQVARGELSAAQELQDESHRALEELLLSQSVPQLIRHVLLLNRAMRQVGTRLYLKIGTTGTGGMGFNIPYTHSEDRPSAKLLTKSAVAFAHTGLLFLMARTPDGPIVKEIKPGAMIGYADISLRTIRERGRTVYLYQARQEPIQSSLQLRQDESQFENLGELQVPVVDTGENGLFARGEFEAITSLRQMEFMTPEDIALEAVLEIRGSNTGRDVIAAIDGAVMAPTYRAGYLRQRAIEELERLEREAGTPSVALGMLGPPELSKLLWEAELLHTLYGTLAEALRHSPAEISAALQGLLDRQPQIAQTITSIGVPILEADGHTLRRGPFIRIPEVPGAQRVPLDDESLNRWAAKGWVDLRPANMERWLARFRRILDGRGEIRGKGSAAITRQVYLFDEIRAGALAGWICNNEQGGYRIK